MNNSSELLTSLDIDELEALADSKLAPSAQERLSDLLARNSNGKLIGDEAKELDLLIARGGNASAFQGRVGPRYGKS